MAIFKNKLTILRNLSFYVQYIYHHVKFPIKILLSHPPYKVQFLISMDTQKEGKNVSNENRSYFQFTQIQASVYHLSKFLIYILINTNNCQTYKFLDGQTLLCVFVQSRTVLAAFLQKHPIVIVIPTFYLQNVHSVIHPLIVTQRNVINVCINNSSV